MTKKKELKKDTINWKFYCTEMFIHQEVEQLYLNNFILYMGNSLNSLYYGKWKGKYYFFGILTEK